MSRHEFRCPRTEYSSITPNLLRQNSIASTGSSAYTSHSSAYLPSRTSTISSTSSIAHQNSMAGHKRGLSEATGFGVASKYGTNNTIDKPPDQSYRNARQSLRPLPQAPTSSSPLAKRHSPNHTRPDILDRYPQIHTENTLGDPKAPVESHQDLPNRPHIHHPYQNHHPSPFVPPDLQELQKSSTGHLRTLSKFAQNSDSEDFSLTVPSPSVVGLSGRRQLKRSDSSVGNRRANVALASGRSHGFGERDWMDKQRQFLQAYEYLCHIGEAKEWIEDIIKTPIPPIVQLEEALRNGITLAEIAQVFYPDQRMRIFRQEKLQFRHIDNIALFFRFLEDIELPDLFRFETVDLYERKNIPKVIYCIHALSWLLYRKGMVDFRIGNLVGQLQFEHHELEQTQRGLDKAGVTMPSFQGMGASFGADPEPVETEEERTARKLQENEATIREFQVQARGALVRMRLGDAMGKLWDSEDWLVDLQSRIRGDWARQIVDYRLNMQHFATNLQAAARGHLARSRQQSNALWWKSKEKDVLRIQNLARAHRVRAEVRTVKSEVRREESGIRNVQAAIRGALARRKAFDQYEASREAETEVQILQAAVRGMCTRIRIQQDKALLQSHTRMIANLQAAGRAFLLRSEHASRQKALEFTSGMWAMLQAVVRGGTTRRQLQQQGNDLRAETSSIVLLQASVRAANSRETYHSLRLALFQQSSPILLAQSTCRGFILRRQLSTVRRDLDSHAQSIMRLQAFSRAAILRQHIGETLDQLESTEEEVVQLQSLSRAMLLRGNIGQLLSELETHEGNIIDLQSFIRASIIRARFVEKRKFFKENMEKVVKIQSVIRAKIQGQAYKSLTAGKNPPAGTLKGFVHLLNDSDFDFDDEIEFERLRKTVVQHVRQNELADQYISQLDIKIALLVKNKITLDEVVKHQKHFGGHVGALLPNADSSSKDRFDLKALNKTSRRKLEHYQELFFLLQTQPQYLSRLFSRMRDLATPEREYERIKHLVMGLFGYAQKRREEYYLVKLIVRSIKEEVDQSNSLQDYIRANSFSNKLFAAYTKSPRDRKYMKDVLGPVIKEHFMDSKLDLESDPLQIYLSSINNEELRTGQRSQRNPGVPREEAIRDPETRATFIHHMQDLRDICDQFFLCLEDTLHRMPFGVRFVVQQAYVHLQSKFRDEDPLFMLQLVGQWLWRNYFQGAITEPEKYGVTDRASTRQQSRNLGEVLKVLTQAVSGREFGGENVYLQPLNTYVRESIDRFGGVWDHVISISSAEDHYDIDEFNDLYAKTKPTVYIKMADIFSVHQLLTSEIDSVCPSNEDYLREVLRELGSVKSNESELMGVSSSEITLTLNPKLHNAKDPDAEIKALFTETKRCVLYIIRIQAGSNLLDILVKPIMPEDEEKWDSLVRDELQSGSKRGAYAEATTLLDISTLSYQDLKRVALENVLSLESVGRLSRSNQYQDLLNDIAVDIRTKHRRRIQRQRELEGVKTTLARLTEQATYLDGQLKIYNNYIEQAMVTLQNKKGKKRFLLPFTKQWDHERELQRSGRSFKFGSYKYSARTLADKGVLVHWKGYTERQWDRIDLTISSNEVGVFTIDGSSGNMMVPGASAQLPLDSLLEAQFNNLSHLDFFEGALRVNVNLFLHLIMKKFYNE